MNSSPQTFTQRQCPVTLERKGVRYVSIESLLANYSQLTPAILQRKKTCSWRMYDEATIVIRSQENDMFPAPVCEPLIG